MLTRQSSPCSHLSRWMRARTTCRAGRPTATTTSRGTSRTGGSTSSGVEERDVLRGLAEPWRRAVALCANGRAWRAAVRPGRVAQAEPLLLLITLLGFGLVLLPAAIAV